MSANGHGGDSLRVFGLALLLGCAAAAGARAQSDAFGHLVVIGGGEPPAYLMERIVELAGGPRCRMTVIPMASSEPLDTALHQRWQLEEAGCPEVDFVRFDRAGADSYEVVDALAGATGVFLSGGDPRRLADLMMGTLLLDRVREILATGGVIAGTDAGAAIMSEVMITGDEVGDAERPREDPRFPWIRDGYVATRPGFGFVRQAVIDQPFVARSLHNRLLSLVLGEPSLVGVGIDESTAAVFTAPDRFEVLGESLVVVYDAAPARDITTDEAGNFSATGVQMHILRSGQGFDLARGRVLPE